MVTWVAPIGLVAAVVTAVAVAFAWQSVEDPPTPRGAYALFAAALGLGVVGTVFVEGGPVALLPATVGTAVAGAAAGLFAYGWEVARRVRTNGRFDALGLPTRLSVVAVYWCCGVFAGLLFATFALTILVGPLA
jgi:hypothetical protein